ncbi:glycosyltransferase family 9 protein [Microbacterium sp. STN6]|uniref:glycosyltransferase family 9 protein n=1 Tax=Microbacterium sp. STN6 TaxID=2995588 RepID=UPI00226094D0|nr:glycosyltransferase family 9 protein [Microbacterium sp. STN6]MCX7523153.1 glycosyltransferase family 9 protein [Microbacterium sp. STN6]
MRRRILVVRLDSAGDVLVSGPAVRAAAAHGEVWMLCGPRGVAAARILPGVARVLEWECPWIVDPAPPATMENTGALLDLVRECAPETALILTSFHQSPLPLALLLRLAGVHEIAAASVDYAGRLLDTRIKPGEDMPEDQPEPVRALTIARAAGFELPEGDDGRMRVAAPPDVTSLVGPGPYVVVHPGAAVPARTWPALQHRQAVSLLAKAGVRVVVTGAEGERALTSRVAGSSGIDLGGRTDFRTLAGVLAGASVLIAGNTGPAHLAAAVGTPVVSLYSPVIPAERWAPYGVPVALLGDQHAACRGSRARECPIAGHPCLARVTPQQVVDACLALAGGAGAHPLGYRDDSHEEEVSA